MLSAWGVWGKERGVRGVCAWVGGGGRWKHWWVEALCWCCLFPTHPPTHPPPPQTEKQKKKSTTHDAARVHVQAVRVDGGGVGPVQRELDGVLRRQRLGAEFVHLDRGVCVRVWGGERGISLIRSPVVVVG